MAKITFITLYDKGCLGVRYISSFLKKEGHSTSIIYLGRHEGRVKDKRDAFVKDNNLWIGVTEYGTNLIRSYSDPIGKKDIDILIGLLKKQRPDIIGFSLRTMFLDTAIDLTARIRDKLNIPIVYGGIAATGEPERCIRYADMVCIGEGERSMLELANCLDEGTPTKDINNMWVCQNGTIYKNPLAPLEQNLDNLPFPDYEPLGKFSILNSGFIENDPSIGNMSRFTYEMITSRGCPFSCTYCCNDLLKRLYAGQRFLRRRSVENVIQEIKEAKAKHNIKSILFKDEIFTFDLEWIKKFSEAYKREVSLPFWCYTHPSFADERILGLLKDCGMFSITMGIQSGSEDILYKIFNRPTPYEKIVKTAVALERLKLPIRPRFDIITNNPFETENDCRKTLDLLMKLSKPLNFGLTKLSFIPGTKIAEMREGLSPKKEVDEKLYKFWNLLYLLNQYSFFPNYIITFLSRNNFFRRNPQLLYFLLFPKFLEIRYQNITAKIKSSLPSRLLILLKRIRYTLKGY